MARDAAYLAAEKKIQQALKKGATELDLSKSYNDSEKLTELPEPLGELTQLQALNLSNNQLTTLPYSLGQLTQLRTLKLSNNQLTTLPDSLLQLTQLRSLNPSNNNLTALPTALGQLTQLQSLNLSNNKLTTLPASLGELTQLLTLNLSINKLTTTLPASLGQLTQLQSLDLSYNQLTALPDSLLQLTQLQSLDLAFNQLASLPDSLLQFTQMQTLNLSSNQLTTLPESLGQLEQLMWLNLFGNHLKTIPECCVKLKNLKVLYLAGNKLESLIPQISRLKKLEVLVLGSGMESHSESWTKGNALDKLPDEIGDLDSLRVLLLGDNQLTELPCSIAKLEHLESLSLERNEFNSIPNWLSNLKLLGILSLKNNNLSDLPTSLAQLEHLEILELSDNPLNPVLKSAYNAGLDELKAYLRSLENAEPLYEAKLVLVGEGNVGKTTLLKALKGRKDGAPKKNEPTTHGVEIDIHGLLLPHPTKDGVEIQLNAWDFGGQDVYRVTHQFFFSRRSLYLLVWEPRRGVQAGQVEDWLNMIRLRVGDDARVLIVSTHCKTGERIARIDQPVLKQQYGEMIVGFYEVDSLVPDGQTGEMVGIGALKMIIAGQASQLEQMGMLFSPQWKAARDVLIDYPEPRISYTTFSDICAKHELTPIATKTLAHLMHDLGYIVYYSDDERLRDDVVLQPQWLTKAIGFVLEDRVTAEREGILPDKHLYEVWHDHSFKDEPRYDPSIYPFFLRLMEKYDVSYRLPDGKASLVAQHVPQVRPELPWLPEQNPTESLRRISMICAMEEDPTGLVPWMIVRTHDYAVEQNNATGSIHRLHWQKGMFLSHSPHGQAMLEKRGREFHIYAQAVWPEYFMNIIQHTLQKMIDDNWPGMEGRYRFMVPCPETVDEHQCKGRFNIHALRQWLAEGDITIRCQDCSQKQSIAELLFGFEERAVDLQLREIKEQLDGLDSRIADYFMAMMFAIADEAKHGPRLFTLRPRDVSFLKRELFSYPLELQLWCEAEGCQHPVFEPDKGVYPIDQPAKWVAKMAPYAKFVFNILKTVASVAAPGINTFFGAKTTETWGVKDQLDLSKALIDKLPTEIKAPGRDVPPGKMLSEVERSGILALHSLLRELDPNHERLGLHRVPTYTGEYRWLCKQHFEAGQSKIPDVI